MPLSTTLRVSGRVWSCPVALLMSTAALSAQPVVETAPTPEDSIKKIVRVTVTATRVPQNLLDVPMGVSYVPAERFDASRHFELKDALWSVPGVFVGQRAGGTDVRITVRGFGARGAANRSNAGNMRSLRVLVDGIPETEPDGRTSLDLINLDATAGVEVLRSNASTLYGSASGGVINLRSPLYFDSSFIESRTTVGSFNFLRTGVTAGAVLDRSRLIVSVVNTTFGDSSNRTFREHAGSSQFLATMALRAPIADATTLGLYASGTSNLFRFPGALTRAEFDSLPSMADPAFVRRDERRHNRVGKLAFDINHLFSPQFAWQSAAWLQPKVIERSERNTYRDFNRYGIGAQSRLRWMEN